MKCCVVDGQHRQVILREYFANPFQDDFDVLVIEKECNSESDIIQYFKVLNHTKAIPWLEDPKMAANRYLEAVVKKFNLPKFQRIRSGNTRHPYLSADELRSQMIKERVGIETYETPEEYAQRIFQLNESELRTIEALPDAVLTTKQKSALRTQFALGLFTGSSWLKTLI